MNNDFTFAI
ncbi:hypothetical protein VCHENC02_1611A, partial [Vibrio harveyi]